MDHPLIVLMPVYEDRQSASKLISELAQYCPQAYVVAVDDGSLRSVIAPEDLSAAGMSGEIVRLARNVGHQRAIAVGLTHLAIAHRPAAVVVMDSDGEDTPAAIPKLLARLKSDADVDVVLAKRRQRTESWQFRAFYSVYRRIFRLLTGRRIRFGNFMAMSGQAARRLATMQEAWVHFPASVMVSRLRCESEPTDRGRRYFGKSSMNFVSLALHGIRSIVVFADDVMVRMCAFCLGLIAAAVMLLGLTVVLKLIGHATPGWFSTAWGLLVVIVLQAGSLSFMTLMTSGTIKASTAIRRADLDLLVERIERAGVEREAVPLRAASGGHAAVQSRSSE